MSHYRSNLRDLEFNLFEVLGAGDRMGKGPFAEMDADTARNVLHEFERSFTIIRYAVTLSSPASDGTIAELHEAVERACPILNLLLNPQSIEGTVTNIAPALVTAGA